MVCWFDQVLVRMLGIEVVSVFMSICIGWSVWTFSPRNYLNIMDGMEGVRTTSQLC